MRLLSNCQSNNFTSVHISDVTHAAKKVLQVPGHANTNFTMNYMTGYAYMRLDDFEEAVVYFKSAHHIDSKNVPLRLGKPQYFGPRSQSAKSSDRFCIVLFIL